MFGYSQCCRHFGRQVSIKVMEKLVTLLFSVNSHPDDEGRKFLQNSDIYQNKYRASQTHKTVILLVSITRKSSL